MKRNARLPVVTGCPDCHKKANKQKQEDIGSSPGVVIRTTYGCLTPDCKVDQFTIERVMTL